VPLVPHLRHRKQAGGIVRILGLSLLVILGAVTSSGAFAQQAKFDPEQCKGRTAQDCNDLMGSLNVPPDQREKTLLVRATALLQSHDLAGATAEYREMTVVNPGSLLAFSTLGFLESLDEKWKEAAVDLKRAVELDPNQDGVRAMLAIVLAKGGDCDGAKTTLAGIKAKAQDAAKLTRAEQTVGEACR
jgi:predicted Zn-dependent protease